MNLYPGNGAGSLSEIIALYLAWGRNFIVVLDADNAGNRERNRYIKEFGKIVEDKIFTLEDIDTKFKGYVTESLTTETDRTRIVKEIYGKAAEYSKKLYNTALQTKYINNDKFKYSPSSQKNLSKVTEFISKKLEEK